MKSIASSLAFASLAILVSADFAVVRAQGAPNKSKPGERFVERGISFSYEMPEGFKPKLMAGQRHRVVFGPVVDGFAANIIVTEETYEGELDGYIEAAIKQLEKATKTFKLIESKEFESDGDADGWVVIMEQEVRNSTMRQHLYVFRTEGKVLVLTCSFLGSEQKKLDPAFAAAMKTFRFEK